MKSSRFVRLLIVSIVAAIAVELPAQDLSQESTTWRQFNQVFVKVIVPVTARSPKQEGPVVESWVAEQLEQLGESDFFAVTDWVPVCDGLLEDDIVDNHIWDGGRIGKVLYCPVGGDIPQRKNSRVLVHVSGWTPGGSAANITLPDEPGNRGVVPVRIFLDQKGKRGKIEEGLPYVAVLITPPPHEGVTSPDETE